MNKPKIAVFDIDNVVLNMSECFTRYMSEVVGIHRDYETQVKDGVYDFGVVFGVDSDTMFKHIQDFNKSDYILSCDLMPGVLNFLDEVERQYDKVIAVTSCGDDEDTIAYRRERLQFIFEEIIFLPLNGSKKETMKQLSEKYDIEMFIDDNAKNLKDCWRYVKNSFLYAWNYNYDDQLYFKSTNIYNNSIMTLNSFMLQNVMISKLDIKEWE